MRKSLEDDLRPLESFKKYQPPAMPADESLRRVSWKLWRWFRSERHHDPFIAEDALNLADKTQLDRLVAPPACGSLLAELDLTFRDWLGDSTTHNPVQLVVLPPCDRSDVLATWAKDKHHAIVDPPSRESLLTGGANEVELDQSHELLVIPKLERWFLRHHNGLHTLGRLFESLGTTQQQVIIGCGSWAYAFLSKAIQTDLVLPTGLTFQPYNRARLSNWFSCLADTDDSRTSVFRFANSGKTIFGNDAATKNADDYFATLAARSRGIPWVAWHLWRQSLKRGPDQDAEMQQKFPEERTVWVAALKELAMPNDEVDVGLLILHSLLIHDRLTPVELAATVPGIQRSNVLAALLKAGFICREGDSFCCEPAAYPAIRERLVDSGFPVDPF